MLNINKIEIIKHLNKLSHINPTIQEINQFTPLIPHSLHILNTTTSTNQILWQLIAEGASVGTVVIATEQTAGRGQWGRKWQSNAGGLYFSVAIAPHLPIEETPQLTMATAWGLAKILAEYQIPVQLKWPNDLILAGRKLGGILTETRVNQGKIHQAVIGIGLNWSNTVPEIGINLCSYFAKNRHPTILSMEELTAIVCHGLNIGLTTLWTKGIDQILPEYCQLLTLVGNQLMVNGRLGSIVGVTRQGELRVKVLANTESDAQSNYSELLPSVSDNLHPNTEIYFQPGEISLGYGESIITV
ncbi:MAG: biotin--[acetyl-CoA-carboxylase] ligase [Microcoleaceae cyanobacterium]